MDDYRKIIQKNMHQLVGECVISPEFLDIFLKRNVFPEERIADIRKMKGSDQVRCFLLLLLQNDSEDAFPIFILALKQTKQDDLVLLLDKNHTSPRHLESLPKPTCVPFELPENSEFSDNEEPLKIQVICSDSIYSLCTTPSYNAISKNRGCVLIINVTSVKHGNKYLGRDGSLVDVMNLQILFHQIGLEVFPVAKNPTKKEIERLIKGFVKNKKLYKADVAFIFIMSHGNYDANREEYVCGSDGEIVYKSWIEKQLSNEVFIYMQGRPKILCYQSCRGEEKDKGTFTINGTGLYSKIAVWFKNTFCNNPLYFRFSPEELQRQIDTKIASDKISMLPYQSDLLIIHSTLEGYVSYRHPRSGSWYISTLCKVFMSGAHNHDVETLIKMVHRELEYLRTDTNLRQTSEYINRHFKVLYLNPGIWIKDGLIQKIN